MKQHIRIATLVLCLCGLAGCSEEPRDFTYYHPGEYKGTVDPLMTKDLHEELHDRFMAGQTDR